MRSAVLALLALVTVAAPLAAKPMTNKFAEPPLISRYDGSVIKNQGSAEFDRTTLTTSIGKDGTFAELVFEGRRTWTAMQGPSGRSGFEVFASYREAIQQAGFQTVFTCSRDQCPNKLFTHGLGGDLYSAIPHALVLYGDGSTQDRHYLLARRKTPAGDEYIRVAVGGPKMPVAVVDVMQPAEREQKVSVLSKDSIASAIASSGKAVLYAIFFDFDSAAIKPQSNEQLAQLAGYLNANPSVNVYIVGHTDGKGTLQYNADLSRRRAAAIAAELTKSYNIAGARVLAQSAGEIAPVSTNDTDAGRALNRRVEIVKRLD
jgi:outer membrane protein OmpA-like peptidoglycan-associated protein